MSTVTVYSGGHKRVEEAQERIAPAKPVKVPARPAAEPAAEQPAEG